ncbi:MAG: CHAT domain-containing protein [Deltaproteobacteria bacterium]|nr:CHAT domain-containing protein [Deltaproteobacteria bacterium]
MLSGGTTVPTGGAEPCGAVPVGESSRSALAVAVSSGSPVVRVAAKMRLRPGGLGDSTLMMTDGTRLSLAEIHDGGGPGFGGLDLLVLASCEISQGTGSYGGAEIEAMGEISLRAGAQAVLATLMPADPVSGPELLGEFCRLRYVEGRNRAEALRGAQLLVMRNAEATPSPSFVPSSELSPSPSTSTSASTSAPASSSPSSASPPPSRQVPHSPEQGGAAGGALPGLHDSSASPERDYRTTPDTGGISPEIPRWEGSGFSHPHYWAPFFVMGSLK